MHRTMTALARGINQGVGGFGLRAFAGTPPDTTRPRE
jgi:hypothetical protein